MSTAVWRAALSGKQLVVGFCVGVGEVGAIGRVGSLVGLCVFDAFVDRFFNILAADENPTTPSSSL